MTTGYTPDHAQAGLTEALPALAVFPNQFKGYTIEIIHPEFTSICPKTGLPDFGTVTLRYEPKDHVVELKALKLYLNGYRNIGIFQENAVNRILEDVVAICEPQWAKVVGDFQPRGGLRSVITATWPPS